MAEDQSTGLATVPAMDAVRVVVVSDSHLSDRTPEALANWRAVVDDVAADPPDVVVHAGDISADGAARPGDLTVARRELDRLAGAGAPAARLLVLPGNHDVGENPHQGQDDYPQVSSERLARYRVAIGPDRWCIDVPGWRLVGLNAQLLGSGLDDEEDQRAWLADAVSVPPHGSRHLALFLHKPLFDPPDRPDPGQPGRYVVPAARTRLDAALEGTPLRAVVCGHVHQFRRHALDGVTHAWAPTTWATLPDRIQPALGRKQTGVLELALGVDGTVGADLRRPDGLGDHVVGDDVADPYALDGA